MESVLKDAFGISARTSSVACGALCSQALLDRQAEGVRELLARSDLPFLFVSRRFDETAHYVQFTPDMSGTLITWLLRQLQSETGLTQDEVEQLAERVKQIKCGSCHFMAQRIQLRWGHRKETVYSSSLSHAAFASGHKLLFRQNPVFVRRTLSYLRA